MKMRGSNYWDRQRLKPMSSVTKSAGVMAITAILYGSVIVCRLAIFKFDPTSFIVAGTEICQAEAVPIPIRWYAGGGYDGQYYFRLALDPFTRQQTAFGIPLDWPAYRQQRILYPALAYALALGQARLVPWTMILVNYLAICALGFTGGMFACAFGRDATWGLLISFYPGLLFSLNRDLTEVLGMSLAVAALLLLHRRQILFGAVTLALAVLARETFALLAGALLVAWAWRMFRGQARWTEGACLMIPLAVFCVWQLWLFATWGNFGAVGHTFILGPPMKDLVSFAATQVSGLPTAARVFILYQLILLAGTVFLAATAVPGSAIDGGVKLAWAGYAFIVSRVTNEWVLNTHAMALLRAASELMALSFLILLGSRYSKLLLFVFVLEIVIWNVYVIVYCLHFPYS
jgi:hypothetical protein